MQPVIDLQLACSETDPPSLDEFRRWVGLVLAEHPQETRHELTIRIVDAQESEALNSQYRGKQRPTNVLSFPFECPPGVELPLLGDLVICAPVVAQEAHEQHKAIHDHWAHLVLHGTLHLLGYDHITDDEATVMEGLETRLLATLNINDPYQPADDGKQS